MPHQCVRCSSLFKDGSEALLKGCSKCGGRFFFFIKNKSVQEIKELTKDLTVEEKEQIEQDVLDIVGDKIDSDKPIILDLETINVLGHGKYEINLVDIFKGKPLVYRLEEGKYVIDIASTFQSKDLGDDEPEEDVY